ncbi:transcription elongation factor A N-terminal and central domain-containing protein [Lampris incognitus]|uniref:transcription elongation factor A N-terminal and central domain-containing protein n=1 Tax=Lampris incognitus TaxID=2546036 RepID=UPI0024B5BE36|nr:transcription elongation factor A N-terminal and central domain-containing protein [Lampris incognitus]
MDAKQIIHSVIHIEKLNLDRSYEDMVALLSELDKSLVSVDQLQTTDIIRVLYRVLKTCSDVCVKKRVKDLLTKWRKWFRDANQTSQDVGLRGTKDKDDSVNKNVTPSVEMGADDKTVLKLGACLSVSGQSRACESDVERARNGEGETILSSPAGEGQSAMDSSSCSLSQNSKPPPLTAGGVPASPNDFSAVRSKCVHLLLSSLSAEAPDVSEHMETAAQLAGDIEKHIHALHGTNQVKYKACVRSKVANLRNPKSCHLRRDLLSGSLLPEVFARMSTEEMAGAELQRLREEYTTQGVSERQLPQELEGTRTQKIRCQRCGGSDCRVTQVSRGTLFLPAWVRRSGPDEDAMTFVTCSGCGEQWYHSGWICL